MLLRYNSTYLVAMLHIKVLFFFFLRLFLYVEVVGCYSLKYRWTTDTPLSQSLSFKERFRYTREEILLYFNLEVFWFILRIFYQYERVKSKFNVVGLMTYILLHNGNECNLRRIGWKFSRKVKVLTKIFVTINPTH